MVFMTPSNLYEFYDSCFQRFYDNLLFDNHFTYGAVADLVAARAAFLQQRGYKKKDVIAILAANSADWVITYMAITSIGAIALNLDTNLTKPEYEKMLAFVRASAVFVSSEYKMRLRGVTSLDIGLDKNMSRKSLKKVLVRETDVATLLFTSGTTGTPKVVQLTHANLVKTAVSGIKHLQVRPNDLCLAILPLYHIYGLIANILGLFGAGAHIVFQPFLKGPAIMESLQNNPVTIFPAVPQLWELFFDGIINKVKTQSALKYRLFLFFLRSAPLLRAIGLGFLPNKVFKPIHDIFGHRMRFLVSAGAPLKGKYFRYYRSLGYTILNAFGLTETTGPVSATTLDTARPLSVGIPLDGNQVQIRNRNRDQIGEVWVRGISVMPGYYRNRKANQEAFDDEGWFNTGDLGYLDRKGSLYVTGRLKNVIVLDSGKNVYPEEVEAWYKRSPLIEELAVFGLNVDGHETVFAVIVPKQKKKNSFQEIHDELHALGRGLPSYKVIGRFALSFDPLPRTSKKSLKVNEIIRLLEQGVYQASDAEEQVMRRELAADSVEGELVISALQEKLDQNKLYGVQTLADFGINSLKMIDMIIFLENRLKISIDTAAFMQCVNLEELVAYLESCEEQAARGLDKRILESRVTTRVRTFFNPVAELLLFLINRISRLCWKLRRLEKAPVEIDNNVIVANHQSLLDVIWIISSLPWKYRKTIFTLGKKEMAFLRILFPGSRMITVERYENVVPALKAGADVLRQGKSLLIFPEGTRSADGSLGEFKTGAAYLAKHLGKDILPVTIKGAHQAMPKSSIVPRFFRKVRAEVVFHKKIRPGKRTSVEQLNDKLKTVIASELE